MLKHKVQRKVSKMFIFQADMLFRREAGARSESRSPLVDYWRWGGAWGERGRETESLVEGRKQRELFIWAIFSVGLIVRCHFLLHSSRSSAMATQALMTYVNADIGPWLNVCMHVCVCVPLPSVEHNQEINRAVFSSPLCDQHQRNPQNQSLQSLLTRAQRAECVFIGAELTDYITLKMAAHYNDIPGLFSTSKIKDHLLFLIYFDTTCAKTYFFALTVYIFSPKPFLARATSCFKQALLQPRLNFSLWLQWIKCETLKETTPQERFPHPQDISGAQRSSTHTNNCTTNRDKTCLW